jgi:hypothetical protein
MAELAQTSSTSRTEAAQHPQAERLKTSSPRPAVPRQRPRKTVRKVPSLNNPAVQAFALDCDNKTGSAIHLPLVDSQQVEAEASVGTNNIASPGWASAVTRAFACYMR